jgi:raffinose/stachyose/melibiose transport system substrate-binding protein
MRRRRLAAALVAVSTAITMAAGGGSPSGSSDQSTGTGTLTFFSWDSEQTMAPIIGEFEKQNPGIKVEFSSAPPVAEYISTLQARILSGTAADVFAIAAENKTNLIDNGAVVDLTDEPFMASLTQFNKDTYGKDGRSYGASISSWGGGIVYNKKLLAKAGVKEFPKSWDEFLALCGKLKDQGVKYPFLESVQAMPIVVAAFVGAESAASGGTLDQKIFDGSSTFAATWTEPLTRWNELYTKGLVPKDVVGLTGDQVRDEFTSGRAAMIPAGPWEVSPIKKANPDLDFEMELVPGMRGPEPYIAGAASPGLAINAKAKNPEAAKKFIAFYTDAKAVAMYNKATDAITTTTDFKPVIDKSLNPIVEPVRAGQIYLPQIAWQRCQDALNLEATAQLQQMVQGKTSPGDAAAALDTKLKNC